MAIKNPCDGCFFFEGRWETSKCCNYFLLTGQRRPCPAGAGCTVRKDGKSGRKKAMTIQNNIAQKI